MDLHYTRSITHILHYTSTRGEESVFFDQHYPVPPVFNTGLLLDNSSLRVLSRVPSFPKVFESTGSLAANVSDGFLVYQFESDCHGNGACRRVNKEMSQCVNGAAYQRDRWSMESTFLIHEFDSNWDCVRFVVSEMSLYRFPKSSNDFVNTVEFFFLSETFK